MDEEPGATGIFFNTPGKRKSILSGLSLIVKLETESTALILRSEGNAWYLPKREKIFFLESNVDKSFKKYIIRISLKIFGICESLEAEDFRYPVSYRNTKRGASF